MAFAARWRKLAWLSAIGAGLSALACGPSFQAVYEGDVRFEHCYALDQGPAPADAKKECWRDWLHGFTYGQSRDRVEYAGTRFSELSLDRTLPSEDVKHPRAMAAAVPVPTNAFAPPPSLAEKHEPVEPAPTASIAPVRFTARPPGEECAETCSGTWKSCRTSCKDGACDACDKSYRACGSSCFKK